MTAFRSIWGCHMQRHRLAAGVAPNIENEPEGEGRRGVISYVIVLLWDYTGTRKIGALRGITICF
jgi:hypothetical protein